MGVETLGECIYACSKKAKSSEYRERHIRIEYGGFIPIHEMPAK